MNMGVRYLKTEHKKKYGMRTFSTWYTTKSENHFSLCVMLLISHPKSISLIFVFPKLFKEPFLTTQLDNSLTFINLIFCCDHFLMDCLVFVDRCRGRVDGEHFTCMLRAWIYKKSFIYSRRTFP